MTNKEVKLKGTYNFSDIDYDILRKITGISMVTNRSIFKEWFEYDYKISSYENKFLTELLATHEFYLQHYSEYQLKAQFLSPLLSFVNFNTTEFKSWYEYKISGTVNNYKLSGQTDFMVATGEFKPEKPYFFFQEFKKSKTNSNPDFQVLAEMAVGIEKNKTNLLRGVYNIGKFWNFVILEKVKEDKYKYYESESLDCLKINDLKQIFINLQAVKHKYCK